jgi:signal transduction histidine kinase
MNILVNAVHAIEDEGEIRIETTVENENLLIEISDTGKGIPTANLDQIFSPGFTTKGVGVGTGLGLSISYNIIQKHNGEIHAQSEEGSGTTITITLPTNLNRSPKR